MMTEGKQGKPSAEPEGEDALWSLLQRASQPPEVSPFFARRVLREVAILEEGRSEGTGVQGWWGQILQAWRGQGRGVFAGALGAVALLAAGARLAPSHWQAAVSSSEVTERVPSARPPVAVADVSVDGEDVAAGLPTPQFAVADPTVTAQDVEVIADLDNLLSHEESKLWTEDDNTTVRF